MAHILPYLPGIFLAYGTFLVGISTPGPNSLAVIGTAMAQGRRSGKALAFGIASGSLLWGILSWLGLVSLLTAYAGALTFIRIAGAGYLLWLAFKAFSAAASSGETAMRQLDLPGGSWAYYRRGLLVQMTNPKSALAWIVIMSLAVHAETPTWVGGAVVVGATLLSVLVYMTYALAFSTARMVAAYRRARRWIEAGIGGFFCLASYALLTSRT